MFFIIILIHVYVCMVCVDDFVSLYNKGHNFVLKDYQMTHLWRNCVQKAIPISYLYHEYHILFLYCCQTS